MSRDNVYLVAVSAVFIQVMGCANQTQRPGADTADSEEIQSEEIQERRGKPNEIQREVIGDKQRFALSVIGHYDIGLDKSSSRASKSVANALTKFVLADRKGFGLTDQDDIQLAVKSIDEVDKYTAVANVNQHVGSLRVLDADLTAAITDDGYLQSLNGRVVPNRSPQAQPKLAFNGVLETLKKDKMSKTMGDIDGFQKGDRNVWHRKDGALIEAGWSRRHEGAIWKAWLPEEVIWIDDSNGSILQRTSQWDSGPTRGCDVRHRNWPRATNGKATSLAQTSATMVSRITCEADDFFGTCSWHLQRQPFGFKHGIARIQDEDGAEKEVQQPCSSNSVPKFTASNGDALREQGAFYVANQMRHFINQNVWTQVAPNRDENVDIHMDVDGMTGAGFNNFFTSIHAPQNFGMMEVIMHEYGHYVVWTYDDVSQNCEQGDDEGDSIDETLANVFAGLYALDSGDINPQYGAYSGLIGAPSPHTDVASLLMHDVNCSQGDPHNQAQAFEQAVWELLFNRDATIDTCTDTTGHGNRIWVGSSRETVIRHIGAALGFSLKVLGQDITHQQIAAQMIIKIKADSGNATGNRAKAVFVHHGVL